METRLFDQTTSLVVWLLFEAIIMLDIGQNRRHPVFFQYTAKDWFRATIEVFILQ